MDELNQRGHDELIALIRGLQATVAKQAELIGELRVKLDDLQDSRQPVMAVSREAIQVRRIR